MYLIPVLSEQIVGVADQDFQSLDMNNPSPSFETIDNILTSDGIIESLEIINGAFESTAQKPKM
jgi:hypothetical protein